MKYLLFAFSILLGFPAAWSAESQIKHLEPAFWWVGMHNPHVQLLVHGSNLSHFDAKIVTQGVRLVNTLKTANPNYLFLLLEIGADTPPQTFQITFYKDQKPAFSHPYTLLPKPGPKPFNGFSQQDVLCLITPDRFVNGNPANDHQEALREKPNRSFPGGRHGGDLEGITKNLDYLKDLGFTAIWLNPVLENNQATYSYHGYSITDFYRVDPRFGSNDGYVEMVRQCHARGMKVIMDVIVNHCGSFHWWMEDLPDTDWINFQNRFVNTSHQRSVIQDPHASKWDARLFNDGWFVETMPDLNQKNPLLANYLIQNAIWWISYSGIDGIRMDTYPYSDKEFMRDWTCALLAEFPDFNIVGEEWSENPAIVAHWLRGKENPNGYTSCLPSAMDFPLQSALRKSLNAKSWQPLYDNLSLDFLYPNPDGLVVFADNHDMSRLFSQVGENVALWKLGLAYLLTTRGIPQIYYGTEILLANPGTEDHGIIRSDFPGGWPGDVVNAFSGKGLSPAQLSAREWLKNLLRWRLNQDLVHRGKLTHFVPQDNVYVFFRHEGEKKLMVALSLNNEEVTLHLDRFKELIPAKLSAFDVLQQTSLALNGVVKLEPLEAMILEIR